MKESQVSRTRRKLESCGQWEKMCRNSVYKRDLSNENLMKRFSLYLQIPGHWQHCAFQPVKRGDVSRATRVGKIVKMLGVDEMQSKVNNDDSIP